DRRERLQKKFEETSSRVSARAGRGINPQLSQSAVGMWPDAVSPVSDQFNHFWVHGTTATANKDIEKTTRLNPTFCYSAHGEAFNINKTAFPVGYHFAPAFTPLVFDPAGPITDSAMVKAKQQFKAGCLAFQASRKANSIIFRYFVGDAVMFCRALALYNKTKKPQTGEFKSHWRATPIDLTEHTTSSPPAPDSFDVIECSTLAMKLGLFNLLLVGQPLLKKSPASQSVLYTEMLLHREISTQIFWKRLWSNVPAVGLLLGLVPRSYLSLFSSTSNAHMYTKAEEFPLFTERIPWVNPTSGDKHTNSESSNSPIFFESDDLARLLFDVYYEMVSYDTTSPERAQRLSPAELQATSDPRFTRETFAMFVAHVKARTRPIDTTWSKVMDFLDGLIAYHGNENSLLNHFYDLKHQLRLHGVLPLEETGQFRDRVRSTRLFSEWPSIPRLLCIVLIVPSAKMDPLRERWSLEPSPRLVCEYGVDYEVLDLTHSSIHATWGKCVLVDGSDNGYVIEEDPEGFQGKSDLVVSFWTDTEMVIPPGMRVWLRLRDTPHTIAHFKDILGPKLQLFEARIPDRDHVLLLRERPMGLSQTQKANRYTISPPISLLGDEYQVKGEFKDPKDTIHSIIAHVKINSQSEKEQLSQVKKAVVSQIGPCSLELTFGTSKRVLRFPYPISQTNIRVNVRKRAYRIDVTASISNPIETGGYP
ncbi:putative MYND finger protein, partial [Rhizoctonia solani 123E]